MSKEMAFILAGLMLFGALRASSEKSAGGAFLGAALTIFFLYAGVFWSMR